MKDEPVPAHELDHATPTVIHHPDEDMTVLARWLRGGMEQGSRFWLLVGGVAAALVALAVLTSGLAAGKSEAGQAWIDLVPAKTAEDRLKVAEAHPKTPVADWARLRAAFEEYDNGLMDLTTPGKKETAGPRLAKALELFREVERDAPKDSSQRLGAAFGVARALEARNELAEAIKQYRLVAAGWVGTAEARQADALAKALEDPENVAFYKELYAYKPPAGAGSGAGSGPGGPLDLLPGGSKNFDVKSLFPGPATPPGGPAPTDLAPPPPIPGPSPATAPAAPSTPAAPKGELPVEPFAPPK